MKSMRIIAKSLPVVLVLVLSGGCSFNFSPVSVKQAALTGGQVLPHRVALVLTPEFTGYKHPFHLMGETDVYPVGDALRDYARNVTVKSFQRVDVVASEQNATALASDDLVLIPRVVKSDTSFGHREFNLTLVVEWTAKDRASQNTVWLKTITADASVKSGSAFSTYKHERMLFQAAFDDLSPKTYQAFQEARELR